MGVAQAKLQSAEALRSEAVKVLAGAPWDPQEWSAKLQQLNTSPGGCMQSPSKFTSLSWCLRRRDLQHCAQRNSGALIADIGLFK